MELSTELTVNIVLVTTNVALIAESMFDSHTIRKIALMKAKRRLNRMAAKDTVADAGPVKPIDPTVASRIKSNDEVTDSGQR